MFGVGKKWSHTARVRSNVISHNGGAAPVYILPKDQKPLGPDGLPKARPVCGSRSGIDYQVQIILSDILEPVAQSMKDKISAISSEDLLSKVEALNRDLQLIHDQGDPQGILKNLGLIGADAEALFPSMLRKPTEEEVFKTVLETDISFKGVNYVEAARYMASTLSMEEARNLGLTK